MKPENLKTGKARRGERGFTLLETLFTSFLFVMILLSVYSVVDLSSRIFNTTNVYSQAMQDAEQTLRDISREIGNTTASRIVITTDANNNNVVRFQVPVDWDNDGDTVCWNMDGAEPCLNPRTFMPEAATARLRVDWGAYEDPGYYRACQIAPCCPDNSEDNCQGLVLCSACTLPQRGEIVGRWIRYSVVMDAVTQRWDLVREVLGRNLVPIAPVLGLTPKIVATNVRQNRGFRVTQTGNRVRVVLVNQTPDRLNAADTGGNARRLESTFSSETAIRN